MYHKLALKNRDRQTSKLGKISHTFWISARFSSDPSKSSSRTSVSQSVTPSESLEPPCLSSKSERFLSRRGHHSFHPNTAHKTGPYPSGQKTLSSQKSHKGFTQRVVMSENSTEKPHNSGFWIPS